MKLTENQKRFIVKNQDKLTIQELGIKFRCNGLKIFKVYSDMIDTGEYRKYFIKPNPRGFKKSESDVHSSIKRIVGYSREEAFRSGVWKRNIQEGLSDCEEEETEGQTAWEEDNIFEETIQEDECASEIFNRVAKV